MQDPHHLRVGHATAERGARMSSCGISAFRGLEPAKLRVEACLLMIFGGRAGNWRLAHSLFSLSLPSLSLSLPLSLSISLSSLSLSLLYPLSRSISSLSFCLTLSLSLSLSASLSLSLSLFICLLVFSLSLSLHIYIHIYREPSETVSQSFLSFTSTLSPLLPRRL